MWTDRHDEANSRFPQYWERVQKRSIKKRSSENVQATDTINIDGKLNAHDGNFILVLSQRKVANTRHTFCKVCPSVRIIREWTSGYSLRLKEQSFTNKLWTHVDLVKMKVCPTFYVRNYMCLCPYLEP